MGGTSVPVVTGISEMVNQKERARVLLYNAAFLATDYGMNWTEIATIIREAENDFHKEQNAPPPGVVGKTPAQIEQGK